MNSSKRRDTELLIKVKYEQLLTSKKPELNEGF
jgi:hypothetical protein